MLTALLALVPLALAAPMETRQTVTSQRIVEYNNHSMCLTARGLSPGVGDVVTISLMDSEACQPPNDQFYLHQYWLTAGVDFTGPLELASFGVCIDAGSAKPGNYSSITLQKCNGSAEQNWYWFGGNGIEINNQCLTRTNETVKAGVCAGRQIETLQTMTCQPFATTQTFTTAPQGY